MDLIDNRTTKIAAMALDGLYERSKAISTNTANALTPNYKRKEVSFEESLRNVIQKEDQKEEMKLLNSQKFASSLNQNSKNSAKQILAQTPEQIAFLNSQVEDGFSINVEADSAEPYSIDGNNVNIETEMMDEAKTGMKYQVVANLLSKTYGKLSAVIQGQTNS